jgi:PIN domain nuclease of toxin-antitoxin system
VKLLLDTHVLLWWLNGDAALADSPARPYIEDPSNVIFVSAVSMWEVAIKESLGKLTVPGSIFDTVWEQGFEQLPVLCSHAQSLRGLPAIHRDPFDRMLIAQATCEQLVVVSADEMVLKYPVNSIAA